VTQPQSEAASVGSRGAAPRWAWWLVAYVLVRFLTGLVRLPPDTAAWVVGLAHLLVSVEVLALLIAAVTATARWRPHHTVWGELAVALCGAAAWLLLARAAASLPGGHAGGMAWASLQDGAKLLAGAALGLACSRVIKERNILLPAALFAAFADFIVVNYGTVNIVQQTEGGRRLLESVSVSVPAVHASIAPVTIGPADVLFLAFFLRCVDRFELNLRLTVALLCVFLVVTLLATQFLERVPALAPLGAAFLLANWRRFHLTRAEWAAFGAVAALVAAAAGAFVWYMTSGRGG